MQLFFSNIHTFLLTLVLLIRIDPSFLWDTVWVALWYCKYEFICCNLLPVSLQSWMVDISRSKPEFTLQFYFGFNPGDLSFRNATSRTSDWWTGSNCWFRLRRTKEKFDHAAETGLGISGKSNGGSYTYMDKIRGKKIVQLLCDDETVSDNGWKRTLCPLCTAWIVTYFL